MRKVCLLAVLTVVAGPALFAQTWREGGRPPQRPYWNRFELTPMIGYTWGGTIYSDTTDLFRDDVDAESSGHYGINFGIPIGPTDMKLELMVDRQDTTLAYPGGLFESDKKVADMHVTYYQAGIQMPFGDPRGPTPYFVFSAGIANLDPQVKGASAENNFSASAGVGVKVPVNPYFGFRFEGRGFFTAIGNGHDHNDRGHDCYCNDYYGHDFYQGQVNVGFVISF